MSTANLPLVAIVGRPNVGKSTLVNRIVGGREAIVEERPGVTRDRKVLTADWNGRAFRVVDTGGWLPPGEGGDMAGGATLAAAVSAQAERAITEADVVVLVVDATVGITEEDDRVAHVLRRAKVPVIVAANKIDDRNREPDLWEFASLGLGSPYPLSAIHGRGSGDILDAVVDVLPPEPDEVVEEDDEKIFSIAIVGRPNVGKSTLFNRMVGDDRAVVHDMPGTTRDTIDTVVMTDDGPLRFIDTAGMRRQSRVDEDTEYYSTLRALRAVDRADAALLVIDATDGATHQDQRLAERIDAAGTAIVIIMNKWELLDAEQRLKASEDVEDRLGFLGFAPIVKLSALTGRGAAKLMPTIREAETAYTTRVSTALLNRVIRDAQAKHPPPLDGRHRARVLYATQGAANPPTFTLFATRRLPQTYLRYLENQFRAAFDLGPTPIKIRVRLRNE